MNVLFAEYKCQDDWSDDRKLWKLAYGKLLKGACRKAESDNQEKIRRIDNLMHKLSIEEKKNNQNIDEMAGIFGEIMGEDVYKRQIWRRLRRTMWSRRKSSQESHCKKERRSSVM